TGGEAWLFLPPFLSRPAGHGDSLAADDPPRAAALHDHRKWSRMASASGGAIHRGECFASDSTCNSKHEEACMCFRSTLSTTALALALAMTISIAKAHDESKYPNWKGQWRVILTPGLAGQRVKFDPTKAWGKGQGAPLTPEYQKIHEDSMADQANGGLGNYPSATCHPGGMPRMMSTGEFEYVVSSDTTYILIGGEDHYRRIFTDGRDWPADIQPTYAGHSIG